MAKSFSSYSGSTTPPTSLFRLLPAEISITFGLMKSRSWIHTTGKHVPSLAEEKRKRDGNLHEIWGCTRNIIFSVPPHVCLHDTFSKPEYDFARDLNEYYSLLPGRYSLAPTETGDDSTRIPRTGKDRKVQLSISVTTP